jgi:hypothetical protein
LAIVADKVSAEVCLQQLTRRVSNFRLVAELQIDERIYPAGFLYLKDELFPEIGYYADYHQYLLLYLVLLRFC